METEGTKINSTHIDEDSWNKFMILAKLCYQMDKEADIYTVFDVFRTKILGGWEYSEAYISKVDAEIAQEEQKSANKRII